MKKICSIITCLAVIMSSIVLVYAENDGMNYIDIGNTASEGNNVTFTNASELQTNTVDGTEHTYRTLDKDGYMLITMKCAPDKVNYLTVKLWGNDTGDTMLWVCDPVTGNMNVSNNKKPARSDLVDRNDWVELNSLKSSPQYNGGFIYATYIIPTVYTEGKSSVTLKIYSTGGSADYSDNKVKEQTESSRGIYAVYMTQNSNFDPSEFETITGGLADTAEISAPSYETQKETAKQYALNAVETFKSWQIYGQDNYPSYMEGMVTRGTDWKNKSKTDTDWKDRYYTTSGMLQQNMTPLNMYEIFALAYKNADKLGYDETEKAELLDRIVKGVDFLVRAQGANGGFYSKNGWIGAPDRANAEGNNLTGFGLRSVAKAIVMVYDDIKDNGYLNKYIDADADDYSDTARKSAWVSMMANARDYLTSLDGAGHAPNQDMADIIAAVRFEKALQMMDSELSWKNQGNEAEIEKQLDIALGFRTNISCSSYWVSPKGLILENFGSIQGGYSGDYGIAALEEMSQLVEFAEYYYGENSVQAKKYTDLLGRAYDSADKFMFTANASVNGNPTLYSEGIISSRNSYYPGTERYVLDNYAAVSRGNKTALKTFEKFFAHNNLEKNSGNYSPRNNVHFEDNVLDIMKLYVNFDNIISMLDSENINGYNYLMENDSVDEYAWADEMGRNVVIKNGEDKIYLALNWRNPIHSTTYYNTAQTQNRQSGLMNNLARVHHKTDRYDKYGYAEVFTEGWSVRTATSSNFQAFKNHYAEAFMYMNYGDYKIIMNSNNLMGNESDISYDIPWEKLELNGLYKDLISGENYYFGDAVGGAKDGKTAKVAPASTMVLYKTATEGEAQISDVNYADSTVTVTASSDEGEKAYVTVYAAEYHGGALVNVEQKKQTVTGNREIKFKYEKTDADNTVKVFVWDNGMKPLFEAKEW